MRSQWLSIYAKGVSPDVWKLAVAAGRSYEQEDKKEGTKLYVYTTSIEELEHQTTLLETSLAAARDPDVSVSSANPSQWVSGPIGNVLERNQIRANATQAQRRLSSRRSFLYSYALRRHHELKFSGIADDIFSRVRERVDSHIGERVPGAVQKLSAVYETCSQTIRRIGRMPFIAAGESFKSLQMHSTQPVRTELLMSTARSEP